MSRVNVSVILPNVSNKSKFIRFCTSLFASELNIELIVCGELDNEILSKVSEDYADKIKIFAKNSLTALSKAVETAQGDFLMFSDVSVTFSGNAIEKMIVSSRGRAAAANVALIKDAESQKAFCDNFSFDELSGKPIYFNHLLSADVIRANSLTLSGVDTLSIMLFIADYYRYDTCNLVNEVLMYSDGEMLYSAEEEVAFLQEYAEVFKLTGNTKATMFYLRAVFSALLSDLTAERFEALKAIASCYKEDYAILSWLKALFGVDVFTLVNEDTDYGDFKYNSTAVYYKEVTLPVTPDSVVKNFYFGKLGIGVLKKCIGAWGYYKFYRRKYDFIKKFGCKVCKKLLGGDFDA